MAQLYHFALKTFAVDAITVTMAGVYRRLHAADARHRRFRPSPVSHVAFAIPSVVIGARVRLVRPPLSYLSGITAGAVNTALYYRHTWVAPRCHQLRRYYCMPPTECNAQLSCHFHGHQTSPDACHRFCWHQV